MRNLHRSYLDQMLELLVVHAVERHVEGVDHLRHHDMYLLRCLLVQEGQRGLQLLDDRQASEEEERVETMHTNTHTYKSLCRRIRYVSADTIFLQRLHCAFVPALSYSNQMGSWGRPTRGIDPEGNDR